MEIEVNKAKLEDIRKEHGLLLILLHGSQVNGRTHEKSDVDIAVLRKDKKSKLKLMELIRDLSVALGTDKVDLSDLTNADPLFLFVATKKAMLLSGKESDFEKLQKLAFHKYSDYLPFLKKEEEFVRQRIKNYVANR
ncbi:MAG: nucleotidyltransferase domain-containing protein [Candidatus Blackburnbacteria bacterium]|nr:nucleotidyltransferase domain-containing protein [Candidatus Blackburnbacteria bacterium]